MPITFEQYIAEFEALDDYGEYGERLKEELKDHFEDSVHSGLVMGKNEAAAKQNAFQNLGEAKIIIHEFKKIMKFNNKYALWMESLFFGIISTPVMQFAILIFAVLTGMYTDEIFPKSIVGGYILSYFLVFLLLFGFYFLIIKRVFRFLDNRKKIFSFGFLLFIVPFLLNFNLGDDFGFLQYILFVLLPGIISFSGIIWIFNKKKDSFLNRKQEKKWWQKVVSWIPLAIALVFIPGILLTNQVFVPMDSSVNRSPLDFMSFVRTEIEYSNKPLLDDFHLNGMLGGNEGFVLLGIIYIILGIISLYHIVSFLLDKTRVKNIQSFPWLSAILLVYVFSLFFLVKLPTPPRISWQVPNVNISEEIKKDQLGFFYRPGVYFYSSFLFQVKPLFAYEIKSEDNFFHVINSDNESRPVTYYLGFPNSDDSFQDMINDILGKPQGPLLGLELSHQRNVYQPMYIGPKELPKQVRCNRIMEKSVRYSDEFEDNRSYCHELYYNEKLIYTQEIAESLYQFEIMPQYPQYALIKFNHPGGYGPQTVYLIKVAE